MFRKQHESQYFFFVLIWIALVNQIVLAQENALSISADTALIQNLEIPQLEAYIQTAIKNNPQIQAQTYTWQSEIKKITAVRGLPDPRIRAGYVAEKMNMPGIPREEWQVGFSQMIPWPGKLLTMGKMQSAMADAAFQKLRNATEDVVFEVKSVYADYYFLMRSIAITKQNLDLIRQWEAVILSKYRTAAAGHADLIKTQIEAIELQDHLHTLENQKAPLIARFGELLGEPVGDIAVPDSIDWTPDNLDKAAWQSHILATNPELLEMQAMERSAGKSLTMARLDWVPDLELGADYMRMGVPGSPAGMESGMHTVMIMGSINIPLWGIKQAAQVKTARFAQLASSSATANMKNRLSAEFESAWSDLLEATRKIALYRDQLIPLSEESLRATEKAYIGGEAEFLSLVDAERRRLDFRLEFENNLSHYLKTVAMLDKLAGRTE